jgi:hypothetical protein
MSSAPKSSIFREEAIQRYVQSREKAVLPRFVTPPIFLLFWCLFTIFLSAGVFAWFGRFPVYATGTGVVSHAGLSASEERGVALIFIPYSPSLSLHAGQPVQLQMRSTGMRLSGTIESAHLRPLSPMEIRQRYQVAIDEPAALIIVHLGSNFSERAYAGSVIVAQVQVGSRRLISLLPGLETLVKES